MTVKELIKQLKKMPPNAKIILWDNKDYNTCYEADFIQEGHFKDCQMLDEDEWRDLEESPSKKYPINAIRIS